MTWDGPYLPVDLTLTTASDPLTWTRSRLECSAWTLTALLAQVLTAIEPPKLFTSRRAPDRTGTVVSVWASAAAVAAARIVIMQLSSSALRAGEGGRLAQQLKLPPHRVGEVMVEICAARVRGERAPRLRDRRIDRGQVALEDPHGGRVEPPRAPPLVQRPLQLDHGRLVAPVRRCEPLGLRQRDRDGSRRDGAGAYQPGRAARQDDQGHRCRDELRHGEREVPPRPRRGRAADPHGDLRPEVGSGRPVVERARPGHAAPRLFERCRARRAAGEMRLERRSLTHSERAVEVLGKAVRPVVLRHLSSPFISHHFPHPHFPTSPRSYRSRCLRSAILA